ncbi:hypothetical protein V1477_006371 [Vespula maculifrons]|uniref:Uncharacterized protein n=1 Tax=Vespula maculifrons TaxID=7453 RepID=A0ABD2CKI2_VESMC
MRVEDATSSFKRPRSGSPSFYTFGEKNFITRLLLARSVRKKYGRRGRDGPFPLTLRGRRALSIDPNPVLVGAIVSEKKIVKEKFPFKQLQLGSYWPDLYAKNMGVEGATGPFH